MYRAAYIRPRELLLALKAAGQHVRGDLFVPYGTFRVTDTPIMRSEPAQPSGERRQVTVLFADMVGFTQSVNSE